MQTVRKLERYNGHLLNWYDLHTMHPLEPRYVSTVDSGNLLASLYSVETGVSVRLGVSVGVSVPVGVGELGGVAVTITVTCL